ncbi:MAG: hypothetical protein R3F53_25240 [Gammaproteobacteria bacterium]
MCISCRCACCPTATRSKTLISLYDTSAGLDAKPVRTFPAPRRTAILAASTDGSKLYAVSWDVTILDAQTGRTLGSHRLRRWARPDYSEPDVLGIWPQWEQTGIYSNPYYAVRTVSVRTIRPPYKTGIFALDLASDDFRVMDFEDTSAIIFLRSSIRSIATGVRRLPP